MQNAVNCAVRARADGQREVFECQNGSRGCSGRAPGSASATRTGSSIAAGSAAALPRDVFDGRPVIGICNTWSELTPCNAHLRRDRRARQARRLGSGRPAVRVPGHLAPARRACGPTAMLFRNLVAHGRRGVDPGQPDRRRRPALRLRQDDAVAGDGRGELRPAGDRRLGRRDAERQVPGRGHRRQPRLEVQRGRQGRRDDRAGLHGRRALPVALHRHLHGDGDRVHDGDRRRRARPVAAAQRRDPRGRLAPLRAGARGRPPDRRSHLRRRPAVEDPDARGVRERDPRQRRGRRIDQRRHPSAGDGRPRRRAADPRRLGPARTRRADARRPHAVGPLHDGGLLLRRRPAAGHAHAGGTRAAAQGRADGQRPDRVGELPRGGRPSTPR